jgi:hypothetical protein
VEKEASPDVSPNKLRAEARRESVGRRRHAAARTVSS